MDNLEILTEKDMEYFRKKEDEGEVVIIELTEEELIQRKIE